MPWYYRCLLAWIGVASVFDQALTTYGVSRGMIHELNPALNWGLMRSPLGAFVIRLGLIAMGIGILVWAYKKKPRVAWFGVVVVSAGLVWVTVLHIRWIDLLIIPLL